MARHGARQVAIAAITIVGSVGIGAQDQKPAPTFRSEINYVQIPVRVLDARGEFVSGLTQSDFQIFEDGQPQTITAGMRAVHRTSYLAPTANADLLVPPKPGEGGKVSTTTTASSLDDQLQELANNPLPVSAMPLRIAAAPFASTAGTSLVSVVVEIPNRLLGFVSRSAFTIETGVPLAAKIRRSPLRVGLRSVMTDIEVPDFSRPRLSVSGITLYDRRPRTGAVIATVTVRSAGGEAVHQTPFAPARPPFGHCSRIPLKQLGTGSYIATVEAVSTTPSRAAASRNIAFRVR